MNLKCSSCGASIEVLSTIGKYSCEYCGAQYSVNKHEDTDRLTAELSVHRLQQELSDIESRIKEIKEKVNQPDSNVHFWIGIIFVAGIFLSLIFLSLDYIVMGLMMLVTTIISSLLTIYINNVMDERSTPVELIELEEERQKIKEQITIQMKSFEGK